MKQQGLKKSRALKAKGGIFAGTKNTLKPRALTIQHCIHTTTKN